MEIYGRNPRRVQTEVKERDTMEECNPVLLTLYLIINEIKYTMLIIQL